MVQCLTLKELFRLYTETKYLPPHLNDSSVQCGLWVALDWPSTAFPSHPEMV
jgi:hypothetical protein